MNCKATVIFHYLIFTHTLMLIFLLCNVLMFVPFNSYFHNEGMYLVNWIWKESLFLYTCRIYIIPCEKLFFTMLTFFLYHCTFSSTTFTLVCWKLYNVCFGRKDYSGSLLPWIIFFLNNVLVIELDFQTVNHLHVYHLLHIITLSTNQKRNPEFYIYNFFSNRVVTDVAHGPLACSCQKKPQWSPA